MSVLFSPENAERCLRSVLTHSHAQLTACWRSFHQSYKALPAILFEPSVEAPRARLLNSPNEIDERNSGLHRATCFKASRVEQPLRSRYQCSHFALSSLTRSSVAQNIVELNTFALQIAL